MAKKTVYHIIEWTIALAACGYLAWRLAIYDDYAALWESLRGMGVAQWAALVLCVALMPVNMALEAWRWRTLMNGGNGERITWHEAQRQVYYSKLAGLITPWRLGEYPARGVIMSEGVKELESEGIWSRVLSMGAVGSATMTIAIIAAGIAAMIIEMGDWSLDTGYYLLVGAVLCLLILALGFAPRLLQRWAKVSHRLILISTLQSFVRLACWCVQLYLVLFALDGLGNPGILGGLGKCAIYYLLVTITPNVPIAEAGVRGAWAIAVFGSVNAALAGVLLWAINTLLPCLVWPFMRKMKNEK